MLRTIKMTTKRTQLTQQSWNTIEVEYRAGLKTLREIAEPHGITASAITQYAKNRGWQRDLSAKIKQKAAEIVRDEEIRARTITPELEQELTEHNAKMLASVQITQRGDVSRARNIVMELFTELEILSDPSQSEALHKLGELVQTGETAAMKRAYRELTSLPTRVKLAKDLSDALKTLILLERTVYGMDEAIEVRADPLQDLIIRISTGNTNTLLPTSVDTDYERLKNVTPVTMPETSDDDEYEETVSICHVVNDDDPSQFDFN